MSQTYEDGVSLTYRYDNDGNLATSTDSATGIKTTYFYDFVGRLRRTEERSPTLTRNTNYIYDANNNLTAFEETNNGTWSKFTYNYDLDNRLSTVTYFDASTSYGYDDFGRLESRTTNNVNVGDIVTESFSYKANSTQVQSMTSAANGRNVQYSYTYDKNGNITAVFDGTYTTSYVYDSANQLIRENNEAAGYTRTWIYDDAGNIKTRKMYEYTETNSGILLEWVDYTYADTQGWGDLLTGVSGYTTVDDERVDIQQTFTYDEIGNPTSDGTWNYTWEHGRRLESMSDGSETWQFSYDTDGLRTKRTNGSTTYTYRYNGDNLRQMKIVSGGQTVPMSFVHNADGPMLIDYAGTLYYYTKNLQGDITGLVDSNGNSVVEYTYDAWGNVLSISGSHADTVGEANPLRYRGYVYDPETKLYYLQSRYYNPETRRFLNADALASTGQGLLGNNMFAYCNNSPVLLSDPSGQSAILSVLVKMAISGSINLATSFLSALITNQEFTFRDGLWSFIAGAGSGLNPYLGGAIGGLYSAYSSYEKGASVVQIIISGATSFYFTAFSLGGLATYLDDGAAIFVESLFTFVSNLLSSGVNKGISDNIPTYNYNINACPWVSPNYTPHTSPTHSVRQNYNALPWSSPNYRT